MSALNPARLERHLPGVVRQQGCIFREFNNIYRNIHGCDSLENLFDRYLGATNDGVAYIDIQFNELRLNLPAGAGYCAAQSAFAGRPMQAKMMAAYIFNPKIAYPRIGFLRMKQFVAAVASNRLLCESMRQLDFCLEGGAELPQPGQFFTVRIINSISPLLRRPFAFSKFDEKRGRASCIYQVRGSGTELLGTLAEDAPLDIIGPLGKPFPFPAPNEKPVLVAGGIGLGPILFFSEKLNECGVDHLLVFGCRSAEYYPETVFGNRSVVVCTDDGSTGFSGTVVDYLGSVSPALSADTVLYCCGPHPMLRGCHLFSADRKIRCVVSVEQTMACGVGACMGCTVKVRGAQAYARACKEGPVFESGDLIWE